MLNEKLSKLEEIIADKTTRPFLSILLSFFVLFAFSESVIITIVSEVEMYSAQKNWKMSCDSSLSPDPCFALIYGRQEPSILTVAMTINASLFFPLTPPNKRPCKTDAKIMSLFTS